MSIIINETTKWFTYEAHQFGVGIVGKRSSKTSKESIDGDSLFTHKMAEVENRDLSNEERAEIVKDCKALTELLKKFYYEDDFIEVN